MISFLVVLFLNIHIFYLSAEPSVRDVKQFSIENRKLHGIVMINNGYPEPECSGKFEVIIVCDKCEILNKIS